MDTARTSLSAVAGCSAVALGLALFATGCGTASLNSARSDFYTGNFQQAEEALSPEKLPRHDDVLFQLERGTIRQARGDYEGSSRDFIGAYDRLTELETFSVSQGAGSLVVNDTIKTFTGAPFERTLMHALTAQNHLSSGQWDNAAVEARRIIINLDEAYRGKYPDVPYARFMAGLALELIDDPSNAALQYRLANESLSRVEIHPDTGRLGVTRGTNEAPSRLSHLPVQAPSGWNDELIVMVQLGRAPRRGDYVSAGGHDQAPIYAEIYANGQYVGRTFPLDDVAYLRHRTEQVRALKETAKTVTRIAIKESIAQAVEHNNNELAGDLVRLVLIGLLEQPDTRSWETLPRWFQAARVPAPPDLTSYELVIKNVSGGELKRVTVSDPLQRRRNLWVSFYRDIPRR